MQTAELSVITASRTQFKAITEELAEIVKRNGWQHGILTVFVPHTTAGVTINENADPDVVHDMEWFGNTLIPRNNNFRHAEGNSDAHIKASFYGSSVQVIVRGGKLCLGTWQGVFFCEFDGPRTRSLLLAFTE